MNNKFMGIAIKEALKGMGKVNPNPLVGAVIVKNGEIISKGYHEYYGGRHAEIVAIDNAHEKGFSLEKSTMFVTLEPCHHYGKTPPCVDRIIKEKFKKVVIAMQDPNKKVAGKSIKKLKENGIEVEVGILENDSKKINQIFLKYITQKNPYVIVKFAMSLDGFIFPYTTDNRKITNEKVNNYVHELRNKFSSILIGYNTLEKDNPRLTSRIKEGINPIRVILDRNLSSENKFYKIFDEKGKNLIINSKKNYKNDKSEGLKINESKPEKILQKLGEREIDSVLIEGGANIIEQFLPYADKVMIFQAPTIFGKGISPFSKYSKFLNDKNFKIKKYDNNILWEFDINVYGNN
ncbi:MAG: bifunctional diaminohydroxyphosphoribosylaminopyrimidine deaminase/5-amino-6-(5-phosphoribosylamino)uracil reductase RibD [Thermotogota bacterium]